MDRPQWVVWNVVDRFYHYDFLDGRLMGSEHPCSLGRPKQLIEHFLRTQGVRALITLTTDFIDYGVPELRQYHVPIANMPSRGQVRQAVTLIHQRLAQNEGVWVHCQQGIDRTGCVIGCYLTATGSDPGRVIAELLQKFPERRRTPRMVELWQPYADMIRSFWAPRGSGG